MASSLNRGIPNSRRYNSNSNRTFSRSFHVFVRPIKLSSEYYVRSVAANVDRKLSRTVFSLELEWSEEISATSMILDLFRLAVVDVGEHSQTSGLQI